MKMTGMRQVLLKLNSFTKDSLNSEITPSLFFRDLNCLSKNKMMGTVNSDSFKSPYVAKCKASIAESYLGDSHHPDIYLPQLSRR